MTWPQHDWTAAAAAGRWPRLRLWLRRRLFALRCRLPSLSRVQGVLRCVIRNRPLHEQLAIRNRALILEGHSARVRPYLLILVRAEPESYRADAVAWPLAPGRSLWLADAIAAVVADYAVLMNLDRRTIHVEAYNEVGERLA